MYKTKDIYNDKKKSQVSYKGRPIRIPINFQWRLWNPDGTRPMYSYELWKTVGANVDDCSQQNYQI